MLKDPESVKIRNSLGFIDSDNPFSVIKQNSLITEPFDYISLEYTGTNLTSVIYKIGGSSGTLVATLTLGYTGSTLISVTKS
jgi:hypothetical protein